MTGKDVTHIGAVTERVYKFADQFERVLSSPQLPEVIVSSLYALDALVQSLYHKPDQISLWEATIYEVRRLLGNEDLGPEIEKLLEEFQDDVDPFLDRLSTLIDSGVPEDEAIAIAGDEVFG